MGRLRAVTVEFNYKEIDIQLKEQFIHGLNDSEMLTEILREFLKNYENMIIPGEYVLTWAKELKCKRSRSSHQHIA